MISCWPLVHKRPRILSVACAARTCAFTGAICATNVLLRTDCDTETNPTFGVQRYELLNFDKRSSQILRPPQYALAHVQIAGDSRKAATRC